MPSHCFNSRGRGLQPLVEVSVVNTIPVFLNLLPGKVCVHCGLFKRYSEFFKHQKTRDGLRGECKECGKNVVKAWRGENPDAAKKHHHTYYLSHREQQLQKSREWVAANRDKVRAIKRRWSHRNSDYLLVKSNQWAANNRDKRRFSVNRWRKANPVIVNFHWRKRHFALKTTGKITQQDWIDLLNLYGQKCLRCGTNKNITLDHVVPLCKGGTHSIENVQPLCKTCNCIKARRSWDFRNPR